MVSSFLGLGQIRGKKDGVQASFFELPFAK
jgi:hypothetical protein